MATPAPSTPSATEMVEGLSDAVAGIGLAFITFLAAVPGLFPVVLLTVLLAAVVLIPMLIAGAAIGAVLGLLVLVARAASRARSVGAGARGRRDRSQPAARRAAVPIAQQAEQQGTAR